MLWSVVECALERCRVLVVCFGALWSVVECCGTLMER